MSVDTSRERIERLKATDSADYIHMALLDRAEAAEAEVERLRDAVSAVDRLPPGVWEAWTSCSYRRITEREGPDGGVLHATIQKSDGHPDLSWNEDQCCALCDLVNGIRALRKGEGRDDE